MALTLVIKNEFGLTKESFRPRLSGSDEDVVLLSEAEQVEFALEMSVRQFRSLDAALEDEIRRMRVLSEAFMKTRRALKRGVLGSEPS